VTATSGDTGSAAIHSVKGKDGLSCVVLFPKDNVSAVQQAQMATESVTNANIHTIAVEGTFDDCQDAVKALFMDAEFKEQVGLSAVNSINWARVLTQMTYYFYAFSRLRGYQNVQFSVPTGNFGDILAGYYALRMGLPIGKLIIATNRNDILTRFMRTGVYRRTVLIGTLAPAMDITISSNFERLLWHVLERELGGVAASEQIISWMGELKRVGGFSVPLEMLYRMQEIFTSQSIDDECILHTIRDINDSHDYLIDPHTATGVCAAGNNAGGDGVTVCLATAHPGKFPETIYSALGNHVNDFVPQSLRDVLDKPQVIHFMKVDNLVNLLKEFILDGEF
jgi:threonine synthase